MLNIHKAAPHSVSTPVALNERLVGALLYIPTQFHESVATIRIIDILGHDDNVEDASLLHDQDAKDDVEAMIIHKSLV